MITRFPKAPFLTLICLLFVITGFARILPDQTILPDGTGVQTNTNQGTSVATDGNFAVVGSPGDSLFRTNAGVVKVYTINNGKVLHIIPNPNERGNFFGRSVAISGSILAVGMPDYLRPDSSSRIGAVFIYDLASSTPTVPINTIENPSNLTGENFALVIDISGQTLVVGASNRNVDGFRLAGTVYAFDIETPGGTLIQTFEEPTPGFDHNFGARLDSDGSKILISAAGYQTGQQFTDVGRAYLFDLEAEDPSGAALTFRNPIPSPFDSDQTQFGSGIGISGNRVVIAARNVNRARGAIYTYDINSLNQTIPIRTLTDPRPESFRNSLGTNLAISGTRILAGAPSYNDNGTLSSGTAYIFDFNSGAVRATINNPSPAFRENFGEILALNGNNVLIGVPDDDTQGSNTGSAYLYFGNSTTPGRILNTTSPQGGDNFGKVITAQGNRVAISTQRYPIDGRAAGRVQVFSLGSSSISTGATSLLNPDPLFASNFGKAIAMWGTLVAVGADYSVYYPDEGVTRNEGVIYIYNIGRPASPTRIIRNPDPANHFGFGSVLALEGSHLIAGTPFNSEQIGGAFYYNLNSSANPTATLINPIFQDRDNFGIDAAIENGIAYIGASGHDSDSDNTGRIYLYNLNQANPTQHTGFIDNPLPQAGVGFGGSFDVDSGRLAAVMTGYQLPTGRRGRVVVIDLNNENTVLTSIDNEEFTGFDGTIDLSTDLVAIGASSYGIASSQTGRTYVYSLTPGIAAAIIDNPTPGVQDRFGNSLGLLGSRLVIGAYRDDTIAISEGAAYFYNLFTELSGTVSPIGSGSISGLGSREMGTLNTITAVPANGWAFLQWIDGVSDNPRIELVPGADPEYRAIFVPSSFTTWQQQVFAPNELTDPTISGELANPSGDGINNMLKFIYGFDPAIPVSIEDRKGLPKSTIAKDLNGINVTLSFEIAAGAENIPMRAEVLSETNQWLTIEPTNHTKSPIDLQTARRTVVFTFENLTERRFLVRVNFE